MTWYEPEADWTYADRRLITTRCLALWIFIALATVGFAILALVATPAFWWAAPALLVLGAWGTWLVFRNVSAHAWAERDQDLIVKRGRLWRSVTVVPYGRMQFVEVTAGPISRALHIATIQLHTASPGTDARLSGVRAADAETLRDRLTARGEASLAGL